MRITEIFRKKTLYPFKRTLKGEPGTPVPLGASIRENGINFAIYAEHASQAILALFIPDEEKPFTHFELSPRYNRTGSVWHIFIPMLSGDLEYGFLVDGPHVPQQGHRYHKEALLLDPYCLSISGGKTWGQAGWPKKGKKYHSNRRSCVVHSSFDWEGDCPLQTPMENTVLYELHVRGFTQDPSSKTHFPGTFQGIIEKIPYLKGLGVTAVELMPIFEFDEGEGAQKNFWGYSTIGFFSPKASYASIRRRNDHLLEFKEMVKSLHRSGVEVILDVVFNHTGEGHEQGPIIHFKGLDNATYYMMGQHGKYLNFSGCGNTVNCNHPIVADFIIECLRYWVVEMHVDGFRFDLASILARGKDGSVLPNPPVLERIAGDPVLKGTKLIAEPWDSGGLYQVGSFPHYGRWAEWNGKFRDDVRSFIKGDDGFVRSFALRILGSPDLYGKPGRCPLHSINFVTCHDGFTLHDLVSYNQKHNGSNGEGNRDGSNDNRSWNCGKEGETEDPKVIQIRTQQMKNFLTVLFISQGVPMLLAGDEFARTQKGNNNAYCQDNEISWISWSSLEKNKELWRFTKEMISLRRRHPVLHQRNFVQENECPGLTWHGVRLHRPDWGYHSHTLAFLLDGRMVSKRDNDFYVAINAFWEPQIGRAHV